MQMITESLAPILAQVHRAAQARANEAAPLFDALAMWVNSRLEDDDVRAIEGVQQILVEQGPPESAQYFSRLLRIVGSSQDMVDGQELQLIMLPWLLFPRQAGEASHPVTDFECRPELERSLEHALDLPYASLRMAEFPVSSLDVEKLSVTQLRRLALDLLAQGDSPALMPAVLDQSADAGAAARQVLLWPAVVRMEADQRDATLAAIRGAVRQTPLLAQFKHRADEMLEQELNVSYDMAMRSDLFMPVAFADAVLMLRVLELNRVMAYAMGGSLRPTRISYRVVAQALQISMHDENDVLTFQDEIRIPEGGHGVLLDGLRAAAARIGLACLVAE